MTATPVITRLNASQRQSGLRVIAALVIVQLSCAPGIQVLSGTAPLAHDSIQLAQVSVPVPSPDGLHCSEGSGCLVRAHQPSQSSRSSQQAAQ
jgi:hypothetical protein